MFKLILLSILIFPIAVFGQTFTGQVYVFSENFSTETCQVIAECDCCSSDLFFMTSSNFCLVDRCISGSNYFKGTYSVKSNKLKLVFDKTSVGEVTDDDYNVIKLQTSTNQVNPVELNISKCGQRYRFSHATERQWKNGSRLDEQREIELSKTLTMSKAWNLLSK